MKPFLIVVLLIIMAGIVKTGFLPLVFLVGGGVFWLINNDKKGGESIFPWLGLIALVGGVASFFL